MRELKTHQAHPAIALIALVTLAVMLSVIRTIAAKSCQQEQTSQQEIETLPPGQEKKLGIGLKPHLPLKVKVKNLNSKRWVHDIEVEVTNTSEKPIYFLSLYLTLPEIKGPLGYELVFWLRFGRAQLIDFSTSLKADDVPIQPGESYTYKIPEGSANGWDYLRKKEGRPEPTKIGLVFQGLNFGDGTGYFDAGGTPVNIHKKNQ